MDSDLQKHKVCLWAWKIDKEHAFDNVEYIHKLLYPCVQVHLTKSTEITGNSESFGPEAPGLF